MKFDIEEIWERFLFYISVPTCVSCKSRLDKDESALCTRCIEKRERLKFRLCSRCGKKLHECSCSSEYLENHYVKKLVKVFRYMQRPDMLPLNAPIYSLKRDNRDDVLELCARELTESILLSFPNAKDFIVTNVPRSKKSIVKYGIDHAELLAKSVAVLIGADYKKMLSGISRITNVKFDVIEDIDLTGKTVLIVDDIVTTGSSMGQAAMLLHGQGAKRIYGAALGIAYKDKYTPFEKSDKFIK